MIFLSYRFYNTNTASSNSSCVCANLATGSFGLDLPLHFLALYAKTAASKSSSNLFFSLS